jgi:Putative MetA-pathway of phenol degradation
MRMRRFIKCTGRVVLSAFLIATIAEHAFAALPFISDDAGTVSKGRSQVELSYERSTDKEAVDGSAVKNDGNQVAATFGHGVADTFDLTLGFARPWGTSVVDGVSSNEVGTAGFTLDAKWRFCEHSGLAFAVKPEIGYSYLVGGASEDHTTWYGGWLIATKETEALTVSLNGGYFYNDYGSAAERDTSRISIWSISALATYEVLEGLALGLDVGASTNPDKSSSEMPAYALGGAIYSLNKNVDLSLGLQVGITNPEPDVSGIAGITISF